MNVVSTKCLHNLLLKLLLCCDTLLNQAHWILSISFLHSSCNVFSFLTLLQAKYLAQIIVMGAQVVGRAFARALQQEFAGIMHNTANIIYLYTGRFICVNCHFISKQMQSLHPKCLTDQRFDQSRQF